MSKKTPAEAAEIERLLEFGFEDVADQSDEYQELERQNHVRTCLDGFDYLNRVDFAKARARMDQIEDETMGGKAAVALQWWRQFMYKREIEMMRNIYSYCRNTAFNTGAFLVGAAHKTGIAKQIEIFNGKAPEPIAWNFYDGPIGLPKSRTL